MDKDNIITVSDLANVFDSLNKMGYGDMQIYFEHDDRPLCDDEINISINDKRIKIRRGIWHDEYTNKVIGLKVDIKKAIDKFYGLEEQNE